MQRLQVVVLLSIVAATSAAAQAPDRARRSPGAPAAQTLLSRTGELELTDAQVVRLAAIARRSAARRRSMTAAMDSAEARFRQPGDSTARRQFAERMRADMQRADEQVRIDQRDALAVLTPDQQARAWSMGSERPGRRMRGSVGPRESRIGRGPRPGRGPRIRGESGRPPRPMEFRRPMRRPLEAGNQ